MIIDAQGYTLDKLDDILSAVENSLRGKYGEDFYIEPKSVVSNIFTSVAFASILLSISSQNPSKGLFVPNTFLMNLGVITDLHL